jgi:CHASE1-domain containing sensor protein
MLIILVVITSLTILSTFMLHKQNDEKQLMLFHNIADKIPSQIENRMKVYEQVLLSGVALFYSSDYVSRQEWKSFINEMQINKNYPGIQGIGFSKLLKPEDLEKHIKSVRDEGFENYTVKPEGIRDIYTSIVYLEPFDERNKRAFGYDMFSESVRNEGMRKSIDTGKYSLTRRVHLLQENGNDV